ncbi:AraC family transcriptional regulator [Spirochaeta thermophila]|uniref:Transcriptional regulator, AraC family n=1 Tax=Winmispira thermophila (strain ATCC 49972 / DSM 6192 / RI 19.B1) TaxID=665571 RepID=E0RSX9_WINT6|nr:AraC family transcriptional regulator [Spirochaeta thermophila]ADN02116.1 transcriptional regulator, AraC family [Spirochaeta thermophila DSM 6192]
MGERFEEIRSRLAEKLLRYTAEREHIEYEIPGLLIHRITRPTEPVSYLLPPSICMVVSGAKRVVLGEEEYRYDAHHFLLSSLDLPVVACIVEATEEAPYLGMRLELDMEALLEVVYDPDVVSFVEARSSRAMAIGEMTAPLLSSFERLVDLLEEPDHIPVLAPLVHREILYRLILSGQGARLKQIATIGSHSHQIARAVTWLKEHFTEPLRILELAALIGMSPSSFHQHFRTLTGMSPLQYQKRLRLNEARRLMLQGLDATSAAFQVGYESLSQFSREYKRLFGLPPSQDIRRLREEGVAQRA